MNLDDIDLAGLKYAELSELKELVELRMEEMRSAGVAALRERLVEEAAALGVTLEEIVASPKGKRGRPRKPHYQDGETQAPIL